MMLLGEQGCSVIVTSLDSQDARSDARNRSSVTETHVPEFRKAALPKLQLDAIILKID